MTVFRDDVYIGAKFKPEIVSLAYLNFNNHYDELEKLGKVKMYLRSDTTTATHKDSVCETNSNF